MCPDHTVLSAEIWEVFLSFIFVSIGRHDASADLPAFEVKFLRSYPSYQFQNHNSAPLLYQARLVATPGSFEKGRNLAILTS